MPTATRPATATSTLRTWDIGDRLKVDIYRSYKATQPKSKHLLSFFYRSVTEFTHSLINPTPAAGLIYYLSSSAITDLLELDLLVGAQLAGSN